ncbi:NACHT, LRR and PYD domains-containing protein 12-like [Patiria miniata]|uniref:Uncharacterized protein n=1 Tax=Patiria miniata TaxID=46514 RepID=A0A914A2K3_PATMI|nr:NACHT, LRR and PYD domains-containing protein 12-like [Patiria miniata]
MEGTITEIKLRCMASCLGEEWKALATYLGVRSDEVNRIQADHMGTEEQIFQMLMIWWQRWDKNGDKDDAASALSIALKKSGRQDLCNTFEGLVKEDVGFEVCRAEIIGYYKDTLGVVPLLPCLLSEVRKINGIYVKLSLIEKENKAGRIVQCHIGSYEDMLRLEFVDGQPVRFILLYGIAGSGKTTIVSKIATDWALQTPGSLLSKFSLLVALSMRELKRAPDLTDAVFDQILAKDTMVSRNSLANHLKSHAKEVLVVLDGADEFDREGSQLPSEGDIIDIISNKVLRGCTVIVTTRPHMVEKLCKLNPSFTRIETTGFSESGVHEYVQKFFTGEEASVSIMLCHNLMESKSLKDLARIPMMLLLICLVWSDAHKLPDTLTELFKEAMLFMLKRHHFEKSSKLCQEEEAIENELMGFVQALGKAALDGLLLPGQKLVFEASDFGNSKMVDKACSLGILSKERVRSKLHSVQCVTFFHKTFQEAIAGFYWASLFESDNCSFNQYRRQIDEENAFSLEYVLRFCCGANVGAAKTLLIHIVDVFSKRNLESSITRESKNLPKSIVWKPVSLQENEDRMIQRLWLLMHVEAQSRELHSIHKPMDRHRLVFDFDCPGDERTAFGFLVDCASSVSVSFLKELQQVSLSTVSQKCAQIVTTILKHGVMKVRDLTLEFGECWNKQADNRWQLSLGKALGKMQLENLSISGPSLIDDYDVSAIFERLSECEMSTSLQTLNLASVAVNPRYLKKSLNNQSGLRRVSIRSQHDKDSRQVLGEALEGLQTQSLEELDIRQCSLSDSHEYCLDRSYPNLEILRLIDDDLHSEDVHHVSSLFPKAPKLQELDLSRNNIGHCFSSLVATFPQLDRLQVLKLTDTGLISEQAVYLARHLPSLVKLRVLSLSRYEYSPKKITPEALLTVLQLSCRCPSLRELDIKQCVLKNYDSDESEFSEYLDDCFLTESEISESLHEGLQTVKDPTQETHQSSIENLDLSSNCLGSFTPHFIGLFKQMPCLQNLDMSSMSLAYADAVLLSEVLRSCRQLQNLHLGDNNTIGNSGLEALLSVVPELPNLMYLSLPDNDGQPSKMVQACLKHGHRYSIIRYFHHFNRPQIEAVVEVVKRFGRERPYACME